jgi:hypothetical protein
VFGEPREAPTRPPRSRRPQSCAQPRFRLQVPLAPAGGPLFSTQGICDSGDFVGGFGIKPFVYLKK